MDNSGTSYNQSNNNLSKKSNLGLIIGILVIVAVIGSGVIFGGKIFLNNSNKDLDKSNNSAKGSIKYYDINRDLRDTYTFKEAVNKFAFKVNETTLIFEANEKVTLDMITRGKTVNNELGPTQFTYKQDYTHLSLETMYLGESSSTTLDEFKTNFNDGTLSNNVKKTVEDIRIIESNDDYFYASWVEKGIIRTYKYYFAKEIDNVVYYAYHSSVTKRNDTEIAILLDEFKSLFNCLSKDDGKEPYIYDKIINVPIVLNKKIKDVSLVSGIINSSVESFDGSVSLVNDLDYVSLEYNASGHYKKIDWSTSYESNVKYMKDDGKDIVGIIDDNNTQIFKISLYSDNKITNYKEFKTYIGTYLTDK